MVRVVDTDEGDRSANKTHKLEKNGKSVKIDENINVKEYLENVDPKVV